MAEQDLSSLLERLLIVLERMESKLSGQSADILTTDEACRLLKISRATLDRRMAAYWSEGVHYWRDGRSLRFDRVLLEDWQRNRNDPTAHQRAIEYRLSQLPGSQKRSRSKVR